MPTGEFGKVGIGDVRLSITMALSIQFNLCIFNKDIAEKYTGEMFVVLVNDDQYALTILDVQDTLTYLASSSVPLEITGPP